MRTALVCVWDIITKLIFNILIKCQFVLRDVFFFYILFIEWYNVQEKLVEANHFQRCNGVSIWLLVPVSTQVPSFLSCDNSYICGKNVDELSYWERSEDEPAATTCFHSTDAQTRFFYPQTFPFLSLFFFSLLRASTDLAKALHFFCIFLCSLFFSPSPSDVSFPAHLPLFVTNKLTAYPSASLHFYLVSHPHPPARHLSQQSMPFHSGEGTNGIPAESAAAGDDSSCPPLVLLQRPQISPGHYHLLTHARGASQRCRRTMIRLLFRCCGAECASDLKKNWLDGWSC